MQEYRISVLLLPLKYKYYNILIINILKIALAENDFFNHSLNQIFRWIFAGAKVENRILIPKYISRGFT